MSFLLFTNYLHYGIILVGGVLIWVIKSLIWVDVIFGKISDTNEGVPEDAKARALRRTLLIRKLNTSRCTTPQELADRFNDLFQLCFDNNFIPTVEALALCSGIDRRDLWRIETGETHKGDGMCDIIKNAKNFIATMEAELARDGEINPTVYIFRAKNYFGMTDKQEVVVTPNTGLQEQPNAEEIIKNLPQLDSGD